MISTLKSSSCSCTAKTDSNQTELKNVDDELETAKIETGPPEQD